MFAFLSVTPNHFTTLRAWSVPGNSQREIPNSNWRNTMKRELRLVVVCVAVMVATAVQVQAALIVTAFESGGNVVFSGGGTVSLGALVVEATGVADSGLVQPAFGVFFLGDNPLDDAKTYKNTISGPSNLGPGLVHVFADSNTGDFFGVNALSPNLYFPNGFTTGGSLSGTSTYNGTTLNAMGLTEGTYVWSWGAGALGAADTLTLNVDANAVPEPTTLAIAFIGLLGIGYRRRK